MKDYIRNDEGPRAMVPDAARGRVRDETAARWGARARLFTRLKTQERCAGRRRLQVPAPEGGRPGESEETLSLNGGAEPGAGPEGAPCTCRGRATVTRVTRGGSRCNARRVRA